MRKKTVFLASVNVCALAMSFFAVYSASQNGKRTKLSHADDEYELVLNATTLAGANGSGSANVRSLNGGAVQFDYTGLSIEGGKLVLASGATIANPRLSSGNNNYISGIKHVAASVGTDDAAAFTLDYTWGESLTAATPYYQRRGYVLSKAHPSYGFLGETPNFLKLNATADSVVESITITYSCSRSAEAGDNLVLSTATQLEQFRTVVNRGNNFAGQTVELGDDIDLSTLDNEHKMSPIGNTDDIVFKGVFDGKNHTIANYTYTGADSIALFSRATNSTIKNLKMSGVEVHYTGSQRAAAVVARAENTTLDNVHVLSGSIGTSAKKVAKQNGGLVAFGTGTVTIKNCSNAANLYASSTNNGGIIGIMNTSSVLSISNCTNTGSINGGGDGTSGIFGGSNNGSLSVTITNCTNNGAVSGAGNGTGGIIGATGGAGTSTTVINGCLNTANISGSAYVGGIGGILREGNKTTSLISECVNKGNISATGVGAGGVAGISRVNTTDCACLHSVTIKGSLASTLDAFGSTIAGAGGASSKPGYISGGAGNGATVTGKLINDDGSDYTE